MTSHDIGRAPWVVGHAHHLCTMIQACVILATTTIVMKQPTQPALPCKGLFFMQRVGCRHIECFKRLTPHSASNAMQRAAAVAAATPHNLEDAPAKHPLNGAHTAHVVLMSSFSLMVNSSCIGCNPQIHTLKPTH